MAALRGALLFGLLLGVAAVPAGAETVDEFLASIKDKPPAERVVALREYTEANKPTKEIWFHLGNAHYEAGEADAAVVAYEQALTLDPNYFKALVNLALMYDDLQQYPKAIETLERAAQIDSTNADVWSHLGNTYYAQDKHAQGVEYYRKALRINPDAAHALYSMGVAFADAGIFREAVTYWMHVSRVEPDSELGKSAAENVELLQRYLIPRN
jgi:tetratricopeptide (TPR) repeat protein